MKQNESITFGQYIKLHKAGSSIYSHLPKSRVSFDISRAANMRKCHQMVRDNTPLSPEQQSSYLSYAVCAKSWDKLTRREFDRLKEIYGEAVVKIMMVDVNFAKWLHNNSDMRNVITSGGACALESIDTRALAILKQRNQKASLIIPQYIKEIALRAPTWTQVTGALIPRYGLNIMYDETFPWYLRMEDYGLQDAESVTQQIYDGIFQSVRRYVRLFDPNSKTISLPFTELNLQSKGLIRKWSTIVEPYLRALEKKYGLEHYGHNSNDQLKAWVMYTYFGPEILSCVKKYIEEKYPALYKEYNVNKATIHIRGKQIDHLDTERSNAWMHSVILKQKDSKLLLDRKKSLLTPFHCQEVAQLQWLFEHGHSLQSGLAGFLDSNYQGRLLHEESVHPRAIFKEKISGNLSSKFFDSPLRLNSHNVAETVQFLERFKQLNSISISKNFLLEFQHIKRKAENINRKIAVLEDFISVFVLIEKFFNVKSKNKTSPQMLDILPVSIKILTKMKKICIKRFNNDAYLKRKLGLSDTQSIDVATYIKDFFDTLQKGRKGKTTINVSKYIMFIKFVQEKSPLIVKQSQQRMLKLIKEKNITDKTSQELMTTVSDNIIYRDIDELATYTNILPLNENYFVTYMQQLLFIKSVRDAYIDMEKIESSRKILKNEKEERIVEIIQKIFPVIEDSIRFIMLGGDYPWDSRFKYQYGVS
ncbi:hypothetical protein COY16_03725 [Candidatus Roizmanbacteria bacterium CG_4_10_14_0_2_um_filter_39_13]|uniref:Uncharacterized protein n=1 Tax=Candidatus Roizmanbacteria bacterium CG_4_10_14_0_2_um_filter_39_13 TaxID=1974825 RepID=A0A2M7TXS8_9BACT|nr:MAG: hypothetical protein COY16_03725 [Candidatus Roizmanbacteria bacterium CG_4_10_14_0_2_um_filter_39_13]